MSAALSPGGYVRQGQRGTSPPRSVNVQVAVRCRPINDRERTHAERSILICDEDRREVVFSSPPTQRKPLPSSASATVNGKRTFTYDHVFGQLATQADVYDRLVEPIVDEVLQGYNCTVFAYGQTGTGKTHTMEGRRHDDVLTAADRRLAENAGIIPRAIKQIFDHLRSLTDEHSVRVSHLELYNEQLTDLLSPEDHDLRVYEDQHKGTFVQGLEDTVVRTEQEIFAVLDKSAMKRKTAETNMNKYSSRSHSIFSITIHIKESTPDGADLLKVGKLNLVDLAGSENIGRSGAVKGRAREAGNINQSLLTLGRVITALVDRHPHVPYRDSKLTRLLQESLGGRNKTCIIATVTPASGSFEETASTLDYAYRAKSIKNRPTVNQMIAKHVLLKDYTDEISKLKRELDATREKNGVYLPLEEYEKMQRTTQSQSSQISDLETKTDEYEKKVAGLRQRLEKTEDALERDQRLLAETQKTLTCISRELDVTKEKLATATQQRDENGLLVRNHVSTEQTLYGQGVELQKSLSKSIADVNSLHTRVDVKAGLELKNMKNLINLKDSVSKQVSMICQQLEEHCSSQKVATEASRRHISKTTTDLEAGFESIVSQFESLRESFGLQEIEDAGLCTKSNERLECDVQKSNAVVEDNLETHAKAQADQRIALKNTCQKISEMFQKSQATMSEMLLSIKSHSERQKAAMNSFSEHQRSTLVSLEGHIESFMSRQKDFVNQLIARSEQDSMSQIETLRSSKVAIVEKLTSVMDELIGGAVSRTTMKQAEDQKLAELMTNEATAAGDAVKQTHESLCDKSSSLVHSCSSAVDTLTSELDVARVRASSDIRLGVANSALVEEQSAELSNAFAGARVRCSEALEGVSKTMGDFRKASSTRRANEATRRHATLEDGLAKLRKKVVALQEEHLETCGDATNCMRIVDDGMETFATFTRNSLASGVSTAVDMHKVLQDTAADQAPPRREWPARVDLARTRNHSSLIEELRSLMSSSRVVPVEDFGQDVPPTPPKPGASARRTEGRDSLTDGSTSGMMDADDAANADDVANTDVVDDDRNDNMKNRENILTKNETSVTKAKENDAEVPSDSESTTSTRTEDDAAAMHGVDTPVLSDVSNKKIRSRLSRRRIEPVIKKPSSIPAPRTRSQRRLPMQ